MTYVIQNGQIASGSMVKPGDILVEHGQIKQIGEHIPLEGLPADTRVIDASGALVLPGIIDAHTHYLLESRGTVTADGFAEGSRAAAYGGVTTVIDFADHVTGMRAAESARQRITRMAESMAVDFALHQSIYRVEEDMEEQLRELTETGVRAVKIFTTYKDAGYLIDTTRLRELFMICRDQEILVTVHAEDDHLIEQTARSYEHQHCPPSMHPVLRPPETEGRAVEQITSLALEAGMPVYIVHVSSQAGLEAVRKARRKGGIVAAETAPHYLLLDQRVLALPDGPLYVMTPPLRTEKDNEALWEALSSGEISTAATDHCAFTPEQKFLSSDCRTILPGIPGSEELLTLMHTYGAASGRFDLPALVRLLSEQPARHFGLYPAKGVIREGSDADLVIFDPSVQWKITNETQHTAAGYTPYAGRDVSGKVLLTMRRGEILVEGGEYLGIPGTGKFQGSGISDLYRI